MNESVWDLPIRLFHAALIVCVSGSYYCAYSSDGSIELHAKLGLFIFSLLVFRILWGFLGSHNALFINFAPTFKRIQAYYNSAHLSTSAPGHTPMGALSVFFMLSLLILQTVTGLFSTNDEIDFNGPLYVLTSDHWSDTFTTLHRYLSDIIVVAICLHIAAILYYLLRKNKNVITPMITGKSSNRSWTYRQQGEKYASYKLLHLVVVLTIALLSYFLLGWDSLDQWLLNTLQPETISPPETLQW